MLFSLSFDFFRYKLSSQVRLFRIRVMVLRLGLVSLRFSLVLYRPRLMLFKLSLVLFKLILSFLGSVWPFQTQVGFIRLKYMPFRLGLILEA